MAEGASSSRDKEDKLSQRQVNFTDKKEEGTKTESSKSRRSSTAKKLRGKAKSAFSKIKRKLGRSGKKSKVSPDGDEEQSDEYSDEDEDFQPPKLPKNFYNKRKSVAAEKYNPEDDDDDEHIVHPKSDEQRRRLWNNIQNILLFRSLETEQLETVVDAMFERVVTEGECVIKQGDDGDNFYVIDNGTYDIYINIDGEDKLVANYDNSGSFGELALMYNVPRTATIIATSDGILWAMDRATFRKIVLRAAYNKRKMYESFLEKVPLLVPLRDYERMNVADALQSRTYEDNETIIAQGDAADCMFIVVDGEVRICIAKNGLEVEVNRLKRGDYLGEIALINHKPRSASAYSVGRTKCVYLDVEAFERLLGPCIELMERHIRSHYE